ncbi:hybrid-cluster NAD(P)-dependent oxidoreductase [Mangrovicoccus sp. HB161399]|uniref:hybrid-cluster NAD(P)-dependent oxidoreductase n=1 Tax=Mangrovicoccus sp. HB161399 TaxID=2720392 RepID=UPI001554AA81|nr:hybrid-cluster NAD(P)-dependent oxidoreductase [Mangrovicoccus sp. HB161399]
MNQIGNLTAPADATIWRDSEELECCSVVPEAPNAATFSFAALSGALFRFQPGQFVTLGVPVPGGSVWRTYTLSSSPSRPLTISVTAKAQKGSIGTRWMLDNLRPGMRIRAMGPAGIFTLPKAERKKYLFISAGSGVTPSLSMTTYLFDRGTAIDATLIVCAKSPRDIIGRNHLESLASRVPGIKLNFIVEEDDPFQVWTGFRGRLNQIMIGLIAGDYLDREIYCCGPGPFMDAVHEMLIDLGYDMSRYQQEAFTGPPVETEAEQEAPDDLVPDGTARSHVPFAASGVGADCTETDTVLAIARAAGLNIPSGCTFGVCGTCKVRKISGEVHMVHNGGISVEDIGAGYILACCSEPIGTVSVDI